jgi:hypothetical protein
MTSDLLALVTLIGSLAFGVLIIVKGRYVLSPVGRAWTIVTGLLAPLAVATLVLSLVEVQISVPLEVAGRVATIVALCWFLMLAVWPKGLVRGRRP